MLRAFDASVPQGDADEAAILLAKATGAVATRHALDAGLTPQWRARPAASQRVARA